MSFAAFKAHFPSRTPQPCHRLDFRDAPQTPKQNSHTFTNKLDIFTLLVLRYTMEACIICS